MPDHSHEVGPPASEKKYGPKKSRASRVRSISSAVVAKDEGLFFLCEPDGRVPLGGSHGLGLYYHDCRFLDGYELNLAGSRPSGLMNTGRAGFKADLVLTNSDLRMADGSDLQKEDVGITWERALDGRAPALLDSLTLRNYTLRPVELPLALSFAAAFEDVFQVRGLPAKARGKLHPPRWQGGALVFAYDGSAGLHRTLTVSFDPTPQRSDGTTAYFHVRLQPQAEHRLLVTLAVAESRHAAAPKPAPADFGGLRRLRDDFDGWLGRQTRVRTGHGLLEKVIDRSQRDLRTLRSSLDGHHYFAAGVPWYVTLFGRDSITAALQTLAYEPEVAAHTLRLLARYQGSKVDAWRDEQPGKVMHELRVGELARTGKIPQTPYYGSIDATPLFLVLLCRHADWTGSLELFHELRENVERALGWMAKYGDPGGDGYLAYEGESKDGLSNQGWKDSGDAIMNADGSLARPPIALAEVQGYAYLAKVGLADLHRRAGDGGRADQLRKEADELRRRFNRDFWLEDKGTYALALQADRRPAAVVASNAGQVLWSGIADSDKAKRTAERLMRPDMFCGWGVRTLSSQEKRFNPIGYHLGTVWPHDNALIAAGLRRYGQDGAARQILAGLLEAAAQFHAYRLPEVFAGFDKGQYGVPVHYPVACHPQAWAAGSVPYLLTALLGLEPDGFAKRLRVVRPVLPDGADELELRGLRVGAARADLRFERGGGPRATVRVLKVEGPLDIVVDESPLS
jgi:glycogen debranching enzyme